MKRPRTLINRSLPVQPLLPEDGEIQLIVHQRHQMCIRDRVITPMKPRQRQAAILEYLQKQGKCSVEELAQYFDLSLIHISVGAPVKKRLTRTEGTPTRTVS